MSREKHEAFIKKIINEQFRIADIDLTFDDISDDKIPNWFCKYSYSEEKNKEWLKFVQDSLIKDLRYSKKKAIIECSWMNLSFGLKIE
jgi:hypothetical protein